MSLQTSIGAIGNLLDERPEYARRVVLPTPVLTRDSLERLRGIERAGFRSITLPATYPIAEGEAGLERAVDALCRLASRAAWDGYAIVVLSDLEIDADHAPIPSLLATAAVHSHLVREGARTMCGLVVESGEPRETMHVALLLGYGAAAVCPYLALEVLDAERQPGFVKGVGDGLLKICSKMGISTIQSYRGAQIFEAVGLGPGLIERYFPGTVSRIGGIELADVHAAQALRHRRAHEATLRLDRGGEYRFRVGGVHHRWNPDAIVALQRAARDDDDAAFARFAALADEDGATLRSLLEPSALRPPVQLEEVELQTELVRRFATGAMSLGSLSSEAHETLAIAMNRIGGRSNTGEGGEDPARSVPDENGDLRRSAIKQVASARFGVTAEYLVDADQLQIKVAQGAKPGEGGQLPGHKVDVTIARLRHSTPGVGLISPPPHHDIYSIEDLAQLIHDLRMVNPQASISVKLVSGAGVGTIAAGVAKAGADHIVIAGHDGGTGAAPLSSLKHVGVAWELGLAETQQVLAANGLRERVRLQVDGGLRTPRDIVVAAMLGAEEFAFSTAPLVAAGCVMMRVCHLNTCPVGIATQDPELRRRFTGTPDHVVTFFMQLASGIREELARLGVRQLDEIVGRADLLGRLPSSLDLSALVHPAPGRSDGPRTVELSSLDAEIWDEVAPAFGAGGEVVVARPVSNTDRSVGAFLAGQIARAARASRETGPITLRLTGHAGQSLAAWAPTGLRIELEGACNDYAGKGLCGGMLTVRPFEAAGYPAERSVLVGNTVLYGATAGTAFLRGRAGERFAVRNSGAEAVIEGVGDHACEYMTGGVVLILGPVGRNLAAGMTGGVAYVFDPGSRAASHVNDETVELEPLGPDDLESVIDLLHRHLEATGSPVASKILAEWPAGAAAAFVKVMPRDLRRVQAVSLAPQEAVGA
jgi:glutamate synthase domain-containing protein 2/glutamate synthase domain-containing protein 3